MAKENYLNRYLLIINRLERGRASYEEIADFLDKQSEIYGRPLTISQRTLQRDIKEIYSLTGYDIQNELKGDKRYYIAERPEEKEAAHRLLESFQMMHAMQNIRGFEDVVVLEKRRSKGLHHFQGLLYAINEKREISFDYTKFQDDIITNRIVHPLALKDSQGRWYLVAVDKKDNTLKTFGLDRMDNVDILKTKYKAKYSYNLHEYFYYAFGINTEGKTSPTIVQLSMNFEKGQYIKNYPLHASQRIVSESENEVLVELDIYVTYDFIMELLSHGSSLKVIRPKSLQDELVKELKKNLEIYLK